MKIGTWILTIGLAASAWAQSPAPKAQALPKPPAATQQSVAKLSVPSPAKTAAPAVNSAAQAAKTAAPAAPAAKSAKPAAAEKQASANSKVAAPSQAAKPGKQPAKQEKPAGKASPDKTVAKASSVHANSVHKGKRDPFVSPIVERKVAVCAVSGKRCLFIGDLNLIGIVESSNGVIAVVANGRHTYFLREHDPLADGEVERITSDMITLRQRTSDLMGRPVVREVTRKIGMPAV